MVVPYTRNLMTNKLASMLSSLQGASMGQISTTKRKRGRPSKNDLLQRKNELELPDGTVSTVSSLSALRVYNAYIEGQQIPEDQLLLACAKLDKAWTPPLPYAGESLCYKYKCIKRATIVCKSTKATLSKHYCSLCYDKDNNND